MKITLPDGLQRLEIINEPGGIYWKVNNKLACGWELANFDKESYIYIFIEGMQSKDYAVTILHCRVDSPPIIESYVAGETRLEALLNDWLKDK